MHENNKFLFSSHVNAYAFKFFIVQCANIYILHDLPHIGVRLVDVNILTRVWPIYSLKLYCVLYIYSKGNALPICHANMVIYY